MHVIVIGAGIIGVTTAYELARDGHRVTVVDRQPGPCRETSFANGGQISASHTDPWASPQNLKRIIGWLRNWNSPIRLSPGLDMAALKWCGQFLLNCTQARNRTNTERMLRLALYSRARLASLCTRLSFDYQRRTNGILHIYRNDRCLASVRQQADMVQELGCVRREISIDECLSIEPALGPVKDQLKGIMYCPDDESGDARLFGVALARECEKLGVNFVFTTSVSGIKLKGHAVNGVITDAGDHEADAIVLAAGSYSTPLLKSLGLDMPVYPVKGYSMTSHAGNDLTCPATSLIDDEHKLVYSRLGDRLRVAGMAELSGYNHSIDRTRAQQLMVQAKSLFPSMAFGKEPQLWSGLRPQTPDSVPVLGTCGLDNLYLNTGHGTLGWTMAVGSARITADLVSGQPPEISLSGLTLERFQGALIEQNRSE